MVRGSPCEQSSTLSPVIQSNARPYTSRLFASVDLPELTRIGRPPRPHPSPRATSRSGGDATRSSSPLRLRARVSGSALGASGLWPSLARALRLHSRSERERRYAPPERRRLSSTVCRRSKPPGVAARIAVARSSHLGRSVGRRWRSSGIALRVAGPRPALRRCRATGASWRSSALTRAPTVRLCLRCSVAALGRAPVPSARLRLGPSGCPRPRLSPGPGSGSPLRGLGPRRRSPALRAAFGPASPGLSPSSSLRSSSGRALRLRRSKRARPCKSKSNHNRKSNSKSGPPTRRRTGSHACKALRFANPAGFGALTRVSSADYSGMGGQKQKQKQKQSRAPRGYRRLRSQRVRRAMKASPD